MVVSMSNDHNVLSEIAMRRLRSDASLSYNLATVFSPFGSEVLAHRSTSQVTACRAHSVQLCNVYHFNFGRNSR